MIGFGEIELLNDQASLPIDVWRVAVIDLTIIDRFFIGVTRQV
jgi:hypothetical protein